MKRRQFLKSSAAAGIGVATAALNATAADKTDMTTPEFYELRLYHLRRGPKTKLFDDFYREAALPAMNRAGISPVGVFNVVYGPDNPTMYILIPHKSLDSFADSNDRVRADADYQKLGAEFINCPATDPAYIRTESFLLRAFPSFPKLAVPAAAAGNKARIFELRTYESHSKKANQKKISMFNNGEIDIFHRTGLRPVFFGETLVGSKMPSLTYMLTFENLAEREKNWAAFIADPDWKKMSTTPGYTDGDVVSNITNLILKPSPCSQI